MQLTDMIRYPDSLRVQKLYFEATLSPFHIPVISVLGDINILTDNGKMKEDIDNGRFDSKTYVG